MAQVHIGQHAQFRSGKLGNVRVCVSLVWRKILSVVTLSATLIVAHKVLIVQEG